MVNQTFKRGRLHASVSGPSASCIAIRLWMPILIATLLFFPTGDSSGTGPDDATGGSTVDGQQGKELDDAVTPSATDSLQLLARRVADLQLEIEQLRRAMGRPKEERTPLAVSGAALREVYFQAVTLFRKTDRLRFELTLQRTAPPPQQQDEIDATAVLQVVDVSLNIVRAIRTELDIGTATPDEPVVGVPSASVLFGSIVQANRQLNLMLDRRFAPSDVYEQVTRAINYAALLLRRFDGATRIPAPPAFQAEKRPADVYAQLLLCLTRMRKIMKSSGLTMLELAPPPEHVRVVTPSDVYDIASLLVSELAHLHRQRGDESEPVATYYPGVKFPAHVYQRVGILLSQLELLEQLAASDPDWLERPLDVP